MGLTLEVDRTMKSKFKTVSTVAERRKYAIIFNLIQTPGCELMTYEVYLPNGDIIHKLPTEAEIEKVWRKVRQNPLNNLLW